MTNKVATARAAADAAAGKALIAKGHARELAAEASRLEEQHRWESWKKIQEDAGYTVEGDSFANAKVVELPEGPTHDLAPGA